tara:strand:+ start:2930 stop:4984 length:2055 start_codon:yes stop_codon:yes gene_type:complete
MFLQSITLTNFGIYKDENKIDFETTKEKPIILCGGRNGGGKTTLFDSVMLGLYGQKSFEKKITKTEYLEFLGTKINKNVVGNIGISNIKKTEAEIKIEFQYNHYDREGKEKLNKDSHNQNYIVKRSWSRGLKGVQEDFIVEKNGSILKIDENDWDKFIQELIPRGIAKLFFFDGEKIADIAKRGEESLEVKNSFESLLGLDIITKLKSDLEINLGRNEKKKGNQNEEENSVEQLKKKIEELEEKKSLEVIRRHKQVAEIEKIDKDIDEYEFEISKMGGDYARDRAELQNEKTILRSKLDIVEEKIHTLCEGALAFCLIPKQLDELKNTLKADQAITKDNYEKEIISEQLKEVKEELELSKFDTKIKSEVIEKIEEVYDKRLSNKINSKIKIGLSESEMNKIFDEMNKISDLPKQLESYSKEFNSVTEKLQIVETKLANAPDDKDIQPIHKKLNEKFREKGGIEAKIREIDDFIQGLKGEITTAKIKGQREIEALHNSQDISTNSDLTKKVTKALEEYSQKLKEKKIQLLENYILESLTTLFHKEGFIKKVSIDKDTFDITLYDKEKNQIQRDSLSEGEKQLFATSILWALARTSGRSLPFIIDTPLGRLDNEHRDSLIEEFFPVASHQTIILSTNSEITKTAFDKLQPYINCNYLIGLDEKEHSSKITNMGNKYPFEEEMQRAV